VLGTSWPAGAGITIRWPDGTLVGSADVQSDGRFATVLRIPQSAVPGTTYKITASGGGRTASADVVIAYAPTLTLLNTFPPRAGTPVAFSGGGWPPNVDYSLVFDGGRTAVATGVTTATGAIAGTFTVPANTTPGAHTVTAVAGAYSANATLTTQ
jgi:hypothetical protein